MAHRKRPVIRLRSQVIWDCLARMKRSQNWLADQLGISRSHLSMLVNQGRAPSGRLRNRMLRFLGLRDFNELFYFEHPGDGE